MHDLNAGSLAIGQVQASENFASNLWEANVALASSIVGGQKRDVEASHFITKTQIDVGDDRFVRRRKQD